MTSSIDFKSMGVKAVALLALSLFFSNPVFASGTKVGNGDDGRDLEGLTPVTQGVLVETRNKAVSKLKDLKVSGIPHLGALIPEVETSKIYLVKKDVAADFSFDKGMESAPDGSAVYARTFAEPHAATRFFPAALMLSTDQLIALHIHEGLHRSLPEPVRENEEVVSKITLAMISPQASNDRVAKAVASTIPDQKQIKQVNALAPVGSDILKPQRPDLDKPSLIGYEYRIYNIDEADESVYPVQGLHVLKSFMHPFGSGPDAWGFGIQLSFLSLPEQSYMGPMQLSVRKRLTTVRQFDLEGFGEVSMVSGDSEFENTPLGRDVTTLGVRAKRLDDDFYVENSLALSLASEAQETVGDFQYTHAYGSITTLSIRAGARLSQFELGGILDMSLADSYTVTGSNFLYELGRTRSVTLGPEFAYSKGSLRASIRGAWVVDSTQGLKLDYLGDIMGRGAGQGYLASSLEFNF